MADGTAADGTAADGTEVDGTAANLLEVDATVRESQDYIVS